MHLGDILNAIKDWVQSLISTVGYPGLALVMFLENVFPPIPSEVILPLAGWLTLVGRFSMFWVTVVGMVGSVAGALVFYGLGRIFGEKRLRDLVDRYGRWVLLSAEDIDRSETWFKRYGEYVIFFGRMVPIIRSVISIPAGLAAMPLLRFCFYTGLGTALWSFTLAYAGRLLGANWPLVEGWINRYQDVVMVLLVVAVVGFVGYRLWRKLAERRK